MFFDKLFEESLAKPKEDSYEEYKKTPENMSYWLDDILNSTTRKNSVLRIPETKVIEMDFKHWDKLSADGESTNAIESLNSYLQEELGSFQNNKDIFLKTGIFSNKFEFSGAICSPERNDLGEKLYHMYYMSMMVGAHMTTEAVFRELIQSKENVPTIYEGMPLHTEFRVFYDFDTHEVVGVSNYWHPDIMSKRNLRDDYEAYSLVRSKIVNEFDEKKSFVASEVAKLAEGVNGVLKGRWSIDVMKNDDEYWLIDMARMDYSALRGVMETV